MGERFGHFLGENLQGILRRNVRECPGILGGYPRENYQREMSRGLFGGIIRKILRDVLGEMYGGEFFFGGEGDLSVKNI